jgi:hypothetical protein
MHHIVLRDWTGAHQGFGQFMAHDGQPATARRGQTLRREHMAEEPSCLVSRQWDHSWVPQVPDLVADEA